MTLRRDLFEFTGGMTRHSLGLKGAQLHDLLRLDHEHLKAQLADPAHARGGWTLPSTLSDSDLPLTEAAMAVTAKKAKALALDHRPRHVRSRRRCDRGRPAQGRAGHVPRWRRGR